MTDEALTTFSAASLPPPPPFAANYSLFTTAYRPKKEEPRVFRRRRYRRHKAWLEQQACQAEREALATAKEKLAELRLDYWRLPLAARSQSPLLQKVSQ